MCRLYGFRATHPTKVECGLLEAQNSLIRQSREDARGLTNDHGWGLGVVSGGELLCQREVEPASESESYRRQAADVRATTVVAHVRRATVGSPAPENTHPFRRDRSLLAHNGHVGAFDAVRPELKAAMRPEERDSIRGSTDSEHLFHYLLSLRARDPDRPLLEVLRGAVRDVVGMVRSADPGAEVALNVIWTVEEEMVGCRFGRGLWYLERDGPFECGVCGSVHPDPDTLPRGASYRAAAVASERITDEAWEEVPEATTFRVDDGMRVRLEPLEL